MSWVICGTGTLAYHFLQAIDTWSAGVLARETMFSPRSVEEHGFSRASSVPNSRALALVWFSQSNLQGVKGRRTMLQPRSVKEHGFIRASAGAAERPI